MNNRKLTLVFVVLFGIWGLTKYTTKDTSHSFKTDLIAIDTSQITIIKIDPKSSEESEMTLQRNTTSQWIATKGTVTVPADRGAVNSFLKNIQLIKTKRVAAKKKERWSDYEVDEEKGTSIKIYAGSQLLEDFVVGRFSFNQQTRQGLSFVRINGGDEVYAIDGFLSRTLRQGFDSYRNKKLLSIVKEDIRGLSLTNENGVVRTYAKANNQWTSDGVAIDSSAIASYLSGITNVVSSNFVDDIDPTTYSIPKYRNLQISGNNLLEPISVTCYRDEARTPSYILQSSENKASYFSSEESDLFQVIFGVLEAL